MTTTAEVARDEVLGAVAAALGAYPDVVQKWQGKDTPDPPPSQSRWSFASMTTANEGQASLANAFAQMKWNTQGVLMVQCFAPLNKGSIDAAMELALSLKRHFRKLITPSGVWFRNASAKEIGTLSSWYQVNFTSTYTFDELQ